MSHPWMKADGAAHQCWVCGQIDVDEPSQRFQFLMVHTPSSRSITIHAGICWRVLEALIFALDPDLPLLSANADGPPLPL